MEWHLKKEPHPTNQQDSMFIYDATGEVVARAFSERLALRIVADHNRFHSFTTSQIDTILDEYKEFLAKYQELRKRV